jgi:hypothetical protein
MSSFTSEEPVALADRLEAQVHDPLNTDDPRWLKRWATKVRRLAEQKERALDRRGRERER